MKSLDAGDGLTLALQLLTIIRDGRVTLVELQDLAGDVLDAVDVTPGEALALAVDEVEDLLSRDPARIRARAALVVSRNPKRAARLFAAAERVEERQAEDDGA